MDKQVVRHYSAKTARRGISTPLSLSASGYWHIVSPLGEMGTKALQGASQLHFLATEEVGTLLARRIAIVSRDGQLWTKWQSQWLRPSL